MEANSGRIGNLKIWEISNPPNLNLFQRASSKRPHTLVSNFYIIVHWQLNNCLSGVCSLDDQKWMFLPVKGDAHFLEIFLLSIPLGNTNSTNSWIGYFWKKATLPHFLNIDAYAPLHGLYLVHFCITLALSVAIYTLIMGPNSPVVQTYDSYTTNHSIFQAHILRQHPEYIQSFDRGGRALSSNVPLVS